MFKLVKISMEGLLALTALAFVALWVILQEYGTVLIWLLAAFLVMKIVKWSSQHKVIRYTYIPPTTSEYPHSTVSDPVAIDRTTLLNKPLDVDGES